MIPVSLKAKCLGVMKHNPADKKATDPQLYAVSLKIEKTAETPIASQINLVTALGGEFKQDALYTVDISFDSAPEVEFLQRAPAAATKAKK